MISTLVGRYSPSLLSILRIFTGLSLLQHGTAKILGFPTVPNFANVQIGSLTGIGGLIELIGGVLFVIGLFTRPVAFILSGFTAVAYFMAHAGKSFYPILNGGELAAVYCFVFLYFVFAGPGPLSLDAIREGKTA
ncbi:MULTISPECIES: DoxX family protein [unclassified Bradyrhizobium]|uniref:DoxX family protein n=1 Tax=unclassified Bradyrhizobium TaxID=2631580 RepID=UPI00041905A0|nr:MULTISPECIES: DoxX family protein [unclassified Bradyrhizobium]QIG97514.1 DoxX family protein [Bradyrhizobium sp. 6(2017)]